MKIYNTVSRQKEELISEKDNTLRIYSCGPTVYNYAHIGNMRTYIFMDIMRRVFKRAGFSLIHVMNITDVGHLVSDSDEGEDKMAKAAREQQKTPLEIAAYYTSCFMKDIASLNIEIPEIIPKATGHIDEMVEFVKELEDKGFAYETGDGIYFDISRFPSYGKLSGIDLEEQLAGARVEVNEDKRNPADFALWKKAPKEHIMQWPSPWGMGYPGWHIECSAMSRKYLGETFDIHTGGVDHIPIHHENEIAQSEALIGKNWVRYWLHAEFLLVDNGKMSKSLGNVYTIGQLENRGFSPLVYRYFCLNGHYRSKLNFTFDGMKAAKISLQRLYDLVLSHKEAAVEKADTIQLEALTNDWEKEFSEAIYDDLNIPKALGIVWNTARYSKKSNLIYKLLLEFDKILGLDFAKATPIKVETPVIPFSGYEGDALPDLSYAGIDKDTLHIINMRQKARAEKNWKTADELRAKLKNAGIVLEDTNAGTKIHKQEGNN